MKPRHAFFMALFGALVIGVAPNQAYADTTFGVQIGTLGGGFFGQWPISPRLAARAGFNVLDASYSTSLSGFDYKGQIKLRNSQLFLDWHPWENDFRWTGGVLWNNNNFELNGQPQQQIFQLSGVNYTITTDGSISTKVSFPKIASYFGLGWGDKAQTKGWNFSSDIGVAYQRRPNVTMVGEGVLGQPGFSGLIQAEQAQLQDTLSRYRWYPILQLGMAYRF